MERFMLRCLLGCFLIVAGLVGTFQPSWAVPAQSLPVPVVRSSFLPAAAELGEQFQALVTGQEQGEIEPQETFGTRALGLVMAFFNLVRDETGRFLSTFAALPQLSQWFSAQSMDPLLLDRWVLIFERILVVVGGAFAAGFVTDLLLLPARRNIRKRETHSLGVRIGILSAWFLLSLVPIVVFVGVAVSLMDQSDPNKLVRYIVMTVVYALAVFRLVRLGFRFLLAPRTPNLRLIPLSTEQALLVTRWINAFAVVMILGVFVPDVARLVKVPAGAITAFTSLIALSIVSMTITIILQIRGTVSVFLRGDLSAARHADSLWDSLRLWLARSWHVMAISYLVIGTIVTMFGGGGFQLMQQGTLLTLLILFLMRYALYLISRIATVSKKLRDVGLSIGIIRPVFKNLLRLSVWGLGFAGIASSWGMDVMAIIMSPWGQRIVGSLFSIGSTIILVTIIYEIIQAAIERKLNKKDAAGHVVTLQGRARTLLPMLHNAAIIVLGVIVGLVTLSEIGINIAPLLAGAGVLGVAVGFGSQTLIKDFLTGLFIILEDTIAVDDVVSIGDSSGVVESMTIRTVRLRDTNGNLHVIPFSEITKIVNHSKTYAFARVDVGVAYDSDLDKVMRVMHDVGVELRQDPEVGSFIVEDTDVQGVETLGDSSITIRCRVKTQPGKQWDVRRAYLLQVKKAFDRENIEIPFPTIKHIRHVEGGGSSPELST